MKISSSETERRNLNLTPLIDVVFLLLIFFMVSTTFEKQSKLKIELPEASQDAVASAQQELTLSISQNGAFYVNNNEVPNAQVISLTQAFRAVSNDKLDMPVTIKADANVAHKHVVMAMDVLGTMGFTTVSMATTKSKKE
mgnify:CR=1 FL=1